MKKLVVGILAHVDAGKTTLSEAMLYGSGSIRKLGRVDNRDAFLDTHDLERQRGITIFSKQAVFTLADTKVTLLDTPGHVDFSAEMERTLLVLDYAVLVINGADGVQGHTLTLWRLLERYRIPVFLFINKMDQEGTDAERLMRELRSRLCDGCVDFTNRGIEHIYENAAMCEEELLESFIENGRVEDADIQRLIQMRKLFPCYFGSALKLTGVKEFLQGIPVYMKEPFRSTEFGAKVFKIARDEQGNRLTYLKITGGMLKVKDLLSHGIDRLREEDIKTREDNDIWQEKVNLIRIYSGDKFEAPQEVYAGEVCAVTGLTKTYPGQGLGVEASSAEPLLAPVLTYGLRLPEGADPAETWKKLRLLEEEEPQLRITWNERQKEIQAKVMGEVQIEILKSLIAERFGLFIEFDAGSIAYKETIADTVEGVGHFEPLRHYAEVHLILEPLETGSGMEFAIECSEDMLEKNWQHLVLTHLMEREHPGVLTGSPITDMRITLAAGRAHQKHTEGGDFRQATYRAVRQGLSQASSVLLEPYYKFCLEVPEDAIGRAMTDMEKLHAVFEMEQNGDGMAVLNGSAPVSSMREYSREVIAYTKGHGRLLCTFSGYAPCHNMEEVIEAIGYEAERDVENPSGSVFCAHGAGFTVPWKQVKEYMHLESQLPVVLKAAGEIEETDAITAENRHQQEEWLGVEEVDAILERTYGANRRGKSTVKRSWAQKGKTSGKVIESAAARTYSPAEKKKSYLLVDGYNIIFAWDELKELAVENIEGARGRLLDILSDYRGSIESSVIVVFDAYRVQGHTEETFKYHNIHVVYTKEAETADLYIEKFAHENGRKYNVTVATSDGLEQIIIRGQGCLLLSARELNAEITRVRDAVRREYINKSSIGRRRLFDELSKEEIAEFSSWEKEVGGEP